MSELKPTSAGPDRIDRSNGARLLTRALRTYAVQLRKRSQTIRELVAVNDAGQGTTKSTKNTKDLPLKNMSVEK